MQSHVPDKSIAREPCPVTCHPFQVLLSPKTPKVKVALQITADRLAFLLRDLFDRVTATCSEPSLPYETSLLPRSSQEFPSRFDPDLSSFPGV